MITWTIGAGGMLGSAIQRAAPSPFNGSVVPWSDGPGAASVLVRDLARFRRETDGQPWGIVWAAGAATVSSVDSDAACELDTLTALLAALRDAPPAGPGAFFLTSSAGGVYAGSADPPFSAATIASPLSPYGELKLRQEGAAAEHLAGVCPVVIGRFGNLYGPGQNLDKLQGLISRLALAAVTQQPLNVFVSLDTIRDYIYVDDAAGIAQWWLADAVSRQPSEAQRCVIATGEGVTVGQLIRIINLVTKRRVPVALGTHASSLNQVLDLRLEPSNATQQHGINRTPLPVGVKNVYRDMLRRVQDAALVSLVSR